MSWRTIVVTGTSKLDYQQGYVVVRGEEPVKVHIDEIETLIVESTAVSVTAYLLVELIKNKVKVLFCDEKRNPSFELMPYFGAHDTSGKIRQQMKWKKEQKDMVWTEIVTEKIRNQAIVLKRFARPEAMMLENYVKEVIIGDETNREGHAAKVYFNALFGKGFSRAEDCPVNAALNYGYSLIRSLFSREIVSCGYITQIGLFHDNMFNQFNLACDLMEPFRPLVDEMVLELQPEQFEKEEKHAMIGLMEKELFIDGRKEHIGQAVKCYVKSVFSALNDQDLSLIKFFVYEL